MMILSFFFFFNDPATTEIYTLSLHDALPISFMGGSMGSVVGEKIARLTRRSHEKNLPLVLVSASGDRKSTRLNSSHLGISYAVFCLKKKKNTDLYYHSSSSAMCCR